MYSISRQNIEIEPIKIAAIIAKCTVVCLFVVAVGYLFYLFFCLYTAGLMVVVDVFIFEG